MRDKKKLMKNVQISMIKNNQSKGEMFVHKISGNWKQLERDYLRGNFEKQSQQ